MGNPILLILGIIFIVCGLFQMFKANGKLLKLYWMTVYGLDEHNAELLS